MGMGAAGMVRLHGDVMKPIHIVIGLLLIGLAVVVWTSFRPSVEPHPAVSESSVLQSLEDPVLSAKPIPPSDTPAMVEAPVAAEDPRQPVQPIEERGDAMLFEIDALHGTPFDEAVVMPFN